MSSLIQLGVDTDNKGIVTLSGTAGSHEAADKAATIARAVNGVTSIENHIKLAAAK